MVAGDLDRCLGSPVGNNIVRRQSPDIHRLSARAAWQNRGDNRAKDNGTGPRHEPGQLGPYCLGFPEGVNGLLGNFEKLVHQKLPSLMRKISGVSGLTEYSSASPVGFSALRPFVSSS